MATEDGALAVAGRALAFGSTANAEPTRAATSLPSSAAVVKYVSDPLHRSGLCVDQANSLVRAPFFFIFAGLTALTMVVVVVASGSSSG